MATEFKLPDLGENIDGGDVVSVLVNVGDVIAPDTEVVEVETDKAMLPVPCSIGGKVVKVHVSAGDTIKIGQVLLTLESDGSAAAAAPAKPAAKAADKPAEKPAEKSAPAPTPAKAAEAPKPAAASAPAPTPAPAPAPAAPPASSPFGPAAGPATRRLARELGVDLSKVRGTGDGGRVTREDIMAAARQANTAAPAKPAAAPAPAAKPTTATSILKPAGLPAGNPSQDHHGPVVIDKLSKIRKVIASNMAASKSTIPHVTNFDDADVTELEKLRQEVKGDYDALGLKLTAMPLILRAVCVALKRHPKLNASLDLENEQIIYKQYVNLGIAVDSERGLVVPHIRNAEQMNVADLAAELGELAEKVRTSRFTPDDLRGGTFTLSNLGAIGGTYSTPVINPPEVAILLIGRSRLLPMVRPDGSIQPRLMMPLSLSYDHRLVDGADASRFLNDVKALLESPSRLLLAP